VPFNLSELNWPLVVIIVAISATVSYVGDVLGKKIGKKRISLLGLRPRYTSTVITVVTGVGVAMSTLGVGMYASDSVKMALFGPNIMSRELTQLNNELRTRQDELYNMTIELFAAQRDMASLRDEKLEMERSVMSLREETDTLKKGLAEMKEGRVIVFQGEMLAQVSMEPEGSEYDLDGVMKRLVEISREYLTNKITETWGADAADTPEVVINEETMETVESALSEAQGRKVLRLTAPSNIVMGQTLEGVIGVFGSDLIYRGGEVMMRREVRGPLTHEEGANVLYTMLKQINRSAVSKGILPDPFSGDVGNLDSLDFYDIVDQIVEAENGRILTFLAAADIYTEGPVRVRIEVDGIR
jgi:hypothetical protein